MVSLSKLWGVFSINHMGCIFNQSYGVYFRSIIWGVFSINQMGCIFNQRLLILDEKQEKIGIGKMYSFMTLMGKNTIFFLFILQFCFQ